MLAAARRLHFEVAPQAGDATTVRVWRSLLPRRRAASLKFRRLAPEFSCSIKHLRWISGLGF